MTPTAADLLNKLEERDLARILKKYGEEKRANQIALAVVEHRQMLGPIQTTRQLQDIVRKVYEYVKLSCCNYFVAHLGFRFVILYTFTPCIKKLQFCLNTFSICHILKVKVVDKFVIVTCNY